MKIHGVALLKNEANENRWLSTFITQMNLLCDRVVILDDCSTDDTAEICKAYGCEVHKNKTSLWGVNELEARQKAWNLVIEKANDLDWIICLDCDELIPQEFFAYLSWNLKFMYDFDVDSIGLRLFDMWSKTHYRNDKWWTAHYRYWPMIVRYFNDKEYKWSDKSLHCGRFPMNAAKKMMPSNIPIRHMGWSNDAFRKEKYKRYMSIDGDGKTGILAQYESILDKKPELKEF